MTLLRPLLWLTLAFAIAVPAQDSAAMLRIKAGQEARNDTSSTTTYNNVDDDNDADDDSEVPPPPEDDVAGDDAARDASRADDALTATIQRQVAQANVARQRRAIEASVWMTLLQADADERPAIADGLRVSDDFDLLLGDDALDEIETTVDATSSTASTSTSTSAAIAIAASEAAAPARKTLVRGKAARLDADARDARVRANLPTEGIRSAPARRDAPDLGATEVRPSHADLARELRAKKKFITRSERGERRNAVADALVAANRTLPSLRAAPVGQMPPELAAALVSLADRGDRVEPGEGDSVVRVSFVRGIASAADGVDISQIGEDDSAAPIDRIEALDDLIEAAEAAAADYPEGSTLHTALNTAAREALDDRTRLAAYLHDVTSSYPRAFATIRLPAAALGAAAVGAGENSAPQAMRFDFTTDSIPNIGPENAVFKQTETTLKADGSLSLTGVDTSGDVPLRLEQRSVATRRMAELLGTGDLVVDMRIAHLDDAAQTMGLVMERAGGEPGLVNRIGTPLPAALAARNAILARIAEADATIAFFDAGQVGNRPPTPLLAADDPASAAWNRDSWFNQSGRLTNSLLNIPIREVPQNGVPTLVGVFQERAITDAHLADPDLRRQLSNAQWLDLLCGQVDRHMGNLFIDTSKASPVVKLIDNDLAFGPNNVVYGLDRPQVEPRFRLPPKPTTIDATFKKHFLSLTENQIRTATQGLLTKAEQDGLAGRLRMLRTYIKSRAVKEVHQPDAPAKAGPIRWNSDPSVLFRGHDRRDIDPTGGEYSYYSLLNSLPQRP